MYNIVIFAIALMFTPSRLRHDYLYAVLEVITDSLQLIVDEFNEYRLAKQYEMSISSQIIYLEKFLNDRYNLELAYASIYITDNLITDGNIYIGNVGEEDAQVYIGNPWAHEEVYAANDEVIYNGKTFKSLFHENIDFPTEGASWTIVAEDEEVYIGNDDEYDFLYEFVVHISTEHWTSISELQEEMRLYINRYKLLGINYTFDIYL